jgi:hypothetical protein
MWIVPLALPSLNLYQQLYYQQAKAIVNNPGITETKIKARQEDKKHSFVSLFIFWHCDE